MWTTMPSLDFARQQSPLTSADARCGHHHDLYKAKWTIVISSELRSCVKVEVDVLGSPSLIVLMVSVDVKQH